MMQVPNDKLPGKKIVKRKFHIKIFNVNRGVSILIKQNVHFKNYRVFKKSSSNGKITVYLGKRDFVDHISHVDPIGNN